jgi:hypothetical protein
MPLKHRSLFNHMMTRFGEPVNEIALPQNHTYSGFNGLRD